MKKRIISIIICLPILFSNISVFAETEIVIESQFENTATFHSDRAAVSLSDAPNNYGYINKSGELILPVGTEMANQEPASFNDDMLVISSEKKDESEDYYSFYTEIYDKNGNLIKNAESTDEVGTSLKVTKYHDGYALAVKYAFEVFNNNIYAVGYVDKTGASVFPDEYEYATIFNEGYAIVGNIDEETNEPSFEIMDTKGEMTPISKGITPFSVHGYDEDSREMFSNGLKEVSNTDNLYGFIDYNGDIVIPCTLPYEPENFSEGLSKVFDGEKYGYINTKGKLVIPYKYEVASDFHSGIALVQDGFNYDERYYIDSSGNKIFEDSFYAKYDFNSRYFRDEISIQTVSIDDDKYKQEDIEYPSLGEFSEGLVSVKDKESGLYGYVNTDGIEVIPCEFDYVGAFSDGLAWVVKGDNAGYIKSPYMTSLSIDGKHVMTDTDPLNKQGKVMVPIEEVAKYFEMKVNINQETENVEITKDDVYINNKIGEIGLDSNGETTEFSTPIIVEDGVPYIYIRDLANVLGYKINWEADTSTVVLNKTSI